MTLREISMRRSVLGAVLAVAAGVGMTLAATPASAGTTEIQVGSCSSGYLCLFENPNYNSGDTNHWRDFSNDANIGGLNWYNGDGSESSDGMNDETSSVKNRLGCKARLYQHENRGGDYADFLSNASVPNLSTTNIGENRASSVWTEC
jgi:hypothetical protein